MKDIYLDTGDADKPGSFVIDFSRVRSGIGQTGQKCLLNLLVREGEDPAYPERGTRILDTLTSYGLLNEDDAVHVANFASAKTILFTKDNETNPLDPESLQEFSLQPLELTAEKGLLLTGSVVLNNDSVLGVREQV